MGTTFYDYIEMLQDLEKNLEKIGAPFEVRSTFSLMLGEMNDHRATMPPLRFSFELSVRAVEHMAIDMQHAPTRRLILEVCERARRPEHERIGFTPFWKLNAWRWK